MSLDLWKLREALKGVSKENAILLTTSGTISYYLFEDGILIVSRKKVGENLLPYMDVETEVLSFEEAPNFLRKEIERILRERGVT